MNRVKLIIIILLLAIFLRIYNTSYSNFQGDEAVIVDLTSHNLKDFVYILKAQFKGPGQYLVTYIAKYIPIENNELKFRLTFILASIIYSIFFINLSLKFNSKYFYITCILLLFSGIILALSRIVQYQSFILLFTVIDSILFFEYLKNKKLFYILLVSIFTSVGILFHFDILIVYFAIVASLILFNKFKHTIILLSTTFSLSVTVWLYLYPISSLMTMFSYITNKRIAEINTLDSFYYSIKLMNLYHPLEFMLIAFGLLIYYFYKNSKSLITASFLSSLFLMLSARLILDLNYYLIYIASITLMLLFSVFFIKENIKIKSKFEIFVNIFFMSAFGFYFLIMRKPLTHIYNIMIPQAILASLGYKHLNNKLKIIVGTFLVISTLSYAYSIFIDTKYEYPFENDKYIFGNLKEISADEKADGVFGFLHFRDYEQIKKDLSNYNPSITNFESNEKSKITDYYLKGYKRTGIMPYYYIYIHNPQSQEKVLDSNAKNLIVTGSRYEIYLVE